MKTLFQLLVIVACYYSTANGQVTDAPPPPVTNDSSMIHEKSEAFAYVEKMPEFKGGQAEMYKFVGANIYMPDTCRERGIAGRVVVQFVVDSLGYVTNTKVVQNTAVDCGYDEIALEMLEKMNRPEPHWLPGRHEGKTVNVSFTLPVNFKFTE
jgi:TonB family protein